MLSLQPFEISVRDLKPGVNRFDWHVGGEFFRSFENSELLDADLSVKVSANDTGTSVEIECTIEGTVVAVCDRCLGEVTLPVHAFFEESETLDLSQDIYDFVCISLPLQKVHPDGDCDRETIKYLKTE